MKNRQLRKSQELKQCTFRPKTATGTTKSHRSIGQFLEDQMKFEEVRKSKQVIRAEQKRQDILEQFKGVPQIDSKSVLLAEEHRRKKSADATPNRVHHRLYQLHLEKRDKSNLSPKSKCSTLISGIPVNHQSSNLNTVSSP